jgi:hypothetical protein
MKVYVARRRMPDGSMGVLSAWPDVYEAKFEALRWEQDMKIEHDYVEGVLTLEEEDGAQTETLGEPDPHCV